MGRCPRGRAMGGGGPCCPLPPAAPSAALGAPPSACLDRRLGSLPILGHTVRTVSASHSTSCVSPQAACQCAQRRSAAGAPVGPHVVGARRARHGVTNDPAGIGGYGVIGG